MSYKVSVPQVDQNGTINNQDLILHEDQDLIANTPKGRFITKDAFVDYVKNYVISMPALVPTDIVAVRFNRHILQMLLAFPDCESLVFVKAKRPEANIFIETIAVVAVDKSGNPLGWDPKPGGVFNAEKFPAVEWGFGITKQQAEGIIMPAINGESDLNFEEFFKSLRD